MAATLRARTNEVLDIGEPGDGLSRFADVALIALITLNVAAVMLESVPDLAAEYGALFYGFEVFSVAVFSVEYVARVWSIVDDKDERYRHPVFGRIRYMFTPMALIDLVAILPFYLGLVVDADLRFLRALRLLRVFKLTRYSASMTLLIDVLKEEVRIIGVALFVLMLMVILAASFAFIVEHRVQPESFSSIPASLWWAIVTMTTVGYGDMVPVTVLGKICGGVIGVLGVGMVALPAGLLASGFSDQLHKRRQQFRRIVDDVLVDGQVSAEEETVLEDAIDELGLNEDDYDMILQSGKRHMAEVPNGKFAPNLCPHCGKPVDRRAGERS
ncbi:MAG: ion transporter [Alphaproteobacteria bacterium]|jgi:voltage-gated potassium channel|nr:ion transporter [Alphaproteobacteria bacterium]